LNVQTNPCRCGYYPDRNKCNCSEWDVRKYTSSVSGPILDRIDLGVRLESVPFEELGKNQKQESSEAIKKRVMSAVNIQRERYRNEDIRFNSQLEGEKIEKYCVIGNEEKALLEQIYKKMNLSVRTYEKILKVSRTVADLRGGEISVADISVAVSFKLNNF
jgi:magnesium chelatase family protein